MKIEVMEVRNIKDDKTFSGRAQLRSYTSQHDEQNVKDTDLRWGVPLMPPTSASTHKIGSSPLGLQKGSRVLVAYADDDKTHQHPFILGSFFRGAEPSNDDAAHDEATHEGGTKNPGVDMPHSPSPEGGKKYENHVQGNEGLEGGGSAGGATGATGLLSGGLSGALSGGGLSSVVSSLTGSSTASFLSSVIKI